MAHATDRVVIMANDAYLEWALSFLESFRRHNPHTPLSLVEYDEDSEQVRRLSTVYDFKVLSDGGFEKVDRLAAKLYPKEEYKRRRLRKLAALTPENGSRHLYLEVDLICFGSVDDVFSSLGDCDLVFLSFSKDFVYRQERLPAALSKFGAGIDLFSSGAFVVSTDTVNFSRIVDVAEGNIAEFLDFRHPHVIDQPLLNYFCHKAGLSTAHFDSISKSSFGKCNVKSRRIAFVGELPIDIESGRPAKFLHWAGAAVKSAASSSEIVASQLAEKRLEYLSAARQRSNIPDSGHVK